MSQQYKNPKGNEQTVNSEIPFRTYREIGIASIGAGIPFIFTGAILLINPPKDLDFVTFCILLGGVGAFILGLLFLNMPKFKKTNY
jgi:hypothetical protein